MSDKIMKRREFSEILMVGCAGMAIAPLILNSAILQKNRIRLGGPVFKKFNDPIEWIGELHRLGYHAAYCPVSPGAQTDLIRAYEKAARDADIVIAEVGAWSNPIDPDEKKRNEAIGKCTRSLELAESIGARCCVNISGSRNPAQWAGPHKDNLTGDTFNLIVETTRKIIDSVNPARTFYALETMPWAYPDSAESYLKLIKAIDRKGFAVHFDPVNLVISPQVYYKTGELITDCFKKLGSRIRSCHAKDILILEDKLNPQFIEVRPGLGNLDYGVFLTELSKLDNVPIMMEHLSKPEDYEAANEHIRSVGLKNQLLF